MGRTKDLEAEWKSKITFLDEEVDSCRHTVNFQDFMAELLVLYRLTYDPRAMEARNLIAEVCHANGLTDRKGDEKRWKRNFTPQDELPPPNYAAAASRLIHKGVSKREAFATVAASQGIRAASWEAAIAQVRRAWEKDQVGMSVDL